MKIGHKFLSNTINKIITVITGVILISAVFIYIDSIYGININKSNALTKEEVEWLKNHGPLIYAADRNAPPLRYLDVSDGQYKGVLIDYANFLSIELGTKIELYPMLWEDALKSLSKGETDMCDMFISEERGKHYLFTKPIYTLRSVIAVNKKLEDEVDSLKDLAGRTMAMQKGDYASEYLKKNYPNIKQIYVADLEEALFLVAQGQADATLGDEPVMVFQMDKNRLDNKVSIIEKPVYEEQVVFAVPKSKPQLVSILNKGIDSLNRKNALEMIQRKWFGISTPIVKVMSFEDIKGYMLIGMIIVMAVILLMTLWNKSLKKQIKLRTKELESSRNELQTVFDGMAEYMLVLDGNRSIRNINKAFLTALGKDKSEIMGRNYKECIDIFSNMELDELMDEALKKGTHVVEEKQFKSYIFQISVTPLKDTNDEIGSVLIFLNDVTNEKISNNKLLQANKMVAIGELAAGIAHEIRNPLGIIRNHSYILRMYNGENQTIKSSLNYIDQAVERARKIIDNLLNFSRISGEREEETNVYKFIENILELQGKIMQKNNINYEIDCKQELRIVINQESLKHILINLISNAIDAIDENGKIVVKAQVEEDKFLLECIDTGVGISKEDLDRIFNPFYTTKAPGKGTGLGLYIVYNEVKKLKGDISVESQVGKGARFSIMIPINKGVKDYEE